MPNCPCCHHEITYVSISIYCNTCISLFTEYMRPHVRNARRQFGNYHGYTELRLISTWYNHREFSICIDRPDERFTDDYIDMYTDMLLQSCGMDRPEERDYVPIVYKHMQIEFLHYETCDDYYRHGMCRFALSGRNGSLYKTTLHAIVNASCYYDLARLPSDQVADLCQLDPTFAVRCLFHDDVY